MNGILRLGVMLLLALVLPVIVRGQSARMDSIRPEQVNLALRKMADGLLRQSGDEESRIAAVEQTAPMVWRVRMDQPFAYEALPGLLQQALDRHGITAPYEVAVRRCADDVIDLGYHQLDWLQDSLVPCSGRVFSEECHFIEVTFLATGPEQDDPTGPFPWWLWLLLGGGLATGLIFLWPGKSPREELAHDHLTVGGSALDLAGQTLTSPAGRQHLTYREAKLLAFFARHPDQVLQRDEILQQVWADEGVLVGRSLDMFVSRLRKKLAGDPTVSIVAVHGVGYRLETGRSQTTQS